ncbi:hypothetical protein VCR15J2_390035 [Vibrio coralliirubri]|nr:hypothetical protein VCR15J2_390035 [Vibrio coralliirubri]
MIISPNRSSDRLFEKLLLDREILRRSESHAKHWFLNNLNTESKKYKKLDRERFRRVLIDLQRKIIMQDR